MTRVTTEGNKTSVTSKLIQGGSGKRKKNLIRNKSRKDRKRQDCWDNLKMQDMLAEINPNRTVMIININEVTL